MLTAKRLRELVSYDPETGKFVWLSRCRDDFATAQAYGVFVSQFQGNEAGGREGQGYIRLPVEGRNYLAHRLAWLYVHGKWPDGEIDHINGDRSDNRITNLRDIPKDENQRNMKRSRRNTSGQAGVAYYPRYGTWKAVIWERGKSVHLGTFSTKEQAVAARKAAERRLGYHPNHGRTGHLTDEGRAA